MASSTNRSTRDKEVVLEMVNKLIFPIIIISQGENYCRQKKNNLKIDHKIVKNRTKLHNIAKKCEKMRKNAKNCKNCEKCKIWQKLAKNAIKNMRKNTKIAQDSEK